jgi:hypothetical protein
VRAAQVYTMCKTGRQAGPKAHLAAGNDAYTHEHDANPGNNLHAHRHQSLRTSLQHSQDYFLTASAPSLQKAESPSQPGCHGTWLESPSHLHAQGLPVFGVGQHARQHKGGVRGEDEVAAAVGGLHKSNQAQSLHPAAIQRTKHTHRWVGLTWQVQPALLREHSSSACTTRPKRGRACHPLLAAAHLASHIHHHVAPPVLRHLPHRCVPPQAAVVIGRGQLGDCEGDDAQDLAGCRWER